MYADIIFISELINDYMILTIVGYISGYKTRAKKLFYGALCGAIISTLLTLFFSDMPVLMNLVSGILLALLMLIVAFKPQSKAVCLRLFLYTYSSAFIMSGINLFFNLHFPGFPGYLLFFLGYILLMSGSKIMVLINKSCGRICRVNVKFENEIKHFYALIDSGNMLYDEISKLPVSIISVKQLPDGLSLNNLRHISFNSLGCANGTLKIINVPYMCIEYKGEKKLIENAPLGISEHRLSASDSYQMIIGSDIINKMEM